MEKITSLEGLKNFCKGKKVLLVGNSTSMLDKEHAEVIDSYDIVVRFGYAVEGGEDTKKFVGNKTTMWVFGDCVELYLKSKFKVKSLRDIKDLEDTTLLFNRGRNNIAETFDIKYKDSNDLAVEMFSDSEMCEFYKTHKINIKHIRLSAGLWTILFFLKKVRADVINIIGFDSFKSKNAGRRGFCASWHNDALISGVHDHELESSIIDFYIEQNKINRLPQ